MTPETIKNEHSFRLGIKYARDKVSDYLEEVSTLNSTLSPLMMEISNDIDKLILNVLFSDELMWEGNIIKFEEREELP